MSGQNPPTYQLWPWPTPQSVKGIAILGSGTISNLKFYHHAVALTCCLAQWTGVRCPWYLHQASYNVFLFLHGNKINLSCRAEGVPNLKLRRLIFRLFFAKEKRKTPDWHHTSVRSSSPEEFSSTSCNRSAVHEVLQVPRLYDVKLWNDGEFCSRGLFEGTLPTFTCRDWSKLSTNLTCLIVEDRFMDIRSWKLE